MTLTRRTFLASVAALPLLSLSVQANTGKSLHFLNCGSTIDAPALQLFRQTTDTDVIMDLYGDETGFIAKFLGNKPRYDVVFATDDSIAHLVQTDLLSPLDRSLIPNAKQLEAELETAVFDPNRTFSLPYSWGTLGIGYRKSAVREVPNSWKPLLDSERYSNRIALLSDKVAVFQATQKYLGYSVNATDPAAIKHAEQLLLKQRPNIKGFSSKTSALLSSRQVDIAMIWSSDFLKLAEKTDDIGYAVPKEGTLIWQKCLSVPRHALDPVAAHKFINFLMDSEVAARLAKKFNYATPNKEAQKLLGEKYFENPALHPPASVQKRLESRGFPDAKQSRLYRTAWQRIRG